MLVFSSTHAALEEKYKNLQDKFRDLQSQWNYVVNKINKKGGEKFLDDGIILSKDTIESLIILCHPDKHNNSVRSQEIKKKLLDLRK